MIQIGAYSDFWPDIHMTPEEGMRAHLDLQGGPGGVMLPIHWATFNLATHAWTDPGEGTLAAGRAAGARVALPRPGEPFEPGGETVPGEPWWRDAARAPVGGWQPPAATTAEAKADTDSDEPKGAAEDGEAPEAVPAG
jgi:hypothetical protein